MLHVEQLLIAVEHESHYVPAESNMQPDPQRVHIDELDEL